MSIGRFRSIGGLAAHARPAAPPVDRATFVVFSIGGHRFATPVERVERVLRPSASHLTVNYGGRTLPLANLAGALGLSLSPSAGARVLVFNEGSTWIAAAVDAVHEVVTIDASAVAPLAFDGSLTYLPVGTRGVFTRHDASILILDVTRTLRPGTGYGSLEYSDPLHRDRA